MRCIATNRYDWILNFGFDRVCYAKDYERMGMNWYNFWLHPIRCFNYFCSFSKAKNIYLISLRLNKWLIENELFDQTTHFACLIFFNSKSFAGCFFRILFNKKTFYHRSVYSMCICLRFSYSLCQNSKKK